MVENYYKKYNFARTLAGQKKVIRNTFTYMKQFQKGYLSEIKSLEQKLETAINEGRELDIEDLEKLLSVEKQEVDQLQKAMERIQEIYPKVQEDNYRDPSEIEEESKKRLVLDERITDLYFVIRYKNDMKTFERNLEEAKKISSFNAREAKIKEIKAQVDEISEVYQILGKAQKRFKYHRDLEHQEYLEKLEVDKQARKDEEIIQVKKVLGQDFNPDMSHCKKGGNSYVWKAEIYRNPQKLFVGESNFKIPQINQKIFAYSYGTFEYGSFLDKDGNPTYVDNLCEIVGITKKEKNGTETTNFVIAPLKYISRLAITPVEQTKRDSIRNRPKTKHGRKRSLLGNLFDKLEMQNEKPNKSSVIKKNDKPMKYTRVVMPEEEKYRVLPEEREFFGNIYLSDYLINNAIENNAHYLGTYTFNSMRKNITFNSPKEDERIDACYFAQNNPGIVTINGFSKPKTVTIDNLEDLFDSLRLKQQILSGEEMRKTIINLDSLFSSKDDRNDNEECL